MSQSAPKSDIPLSPFEKIVNGQKCLSARVCPRHPRFLLFHSCNSCDSWLPFGCGLWPLQVRARERDGSHCGAMGSDDSQGAHFRLNPIPEDEPLGPESEPLGLFWGLGPVFPLDEDEQPVGQLYRFDAPLLSNAR